MDVFRRNYRIYYSVLCFTGLWPFYQSALPKIQRICYSVCTLTCIAIQVTTIKNVDITLNNLLRMLSFTCPMILFVLRYLGFIANFSILKSFIQDIQDDCTTLEDPIEVKILMKYIKESKRIILIFIGLSCTGIIFLASTVVLPTVLKRQYQPYYLRFYGFFYSEPNKQTDWTCVHLTLASTIGLLTVACTEGTLSLFCFYLCGLFEIASYRIRKAIDSGAKLIRPKTIDIRPAIDVHQRALKLADAIAKGVVISYLLAIIVVIVSFAVNLYRVFLLVMEMDQIQEIVISALIVATHVVIMFLNNHGGQKLATTSGRLFDETWNSLWYCVPLKTQKLLLFVLMNTSTDVQFNLAGLFVPCYQGFSTMMSSSFSYFTVLYSMQ